MTFSGTIVKYPEYTHYIITMAGPNQSQMLSM